MLEELMSVAANAGKLLELAKDSGIEMNWKLLAFMASSWAMVEMVRRIGSKGGCVAGKAISAGYKWATSEKPLSEEEASLLNKLIHGIYDVEGDTLTGSDGQSIACVEGGRLVVVAFDRDVSAVLTDRLKKKIKAEIESHRKVVRDQNREEARAALVRLNRKMPEFPRSIGGIPVSNAKKV